LRSNSLPLLSLRTKVQGATLLRSAGCGQEKAGALSTSMRQSLGHRRLTSGFAVSMKSEAGVATQALACAGSTPLPFKRPGVAVAPAWVIACADGETNSVAAALVMAWLMGCPPMLVGSEPGVAVPAVAVVAVVADVALLVVAPLAAVATAGVVDGSGFAASGCAVAALAASDWAEAASSGADAIKSGLLAAGAFAAPGSDGAMAAADCSGPPPPPPPHPSNRTLLAIKLSIGALGKWGGRLFMVPGYSLPTAVDAPQAPGALRGAGATAGS